MESMVQYEAFDYTQIESMTDSVKLRDIEVEIKETTSKYADKLGELLFKAQEVLANNKNGLFGKWVESIGISRNTANKMIQRHNYIVTNSYNMDELSLSLTYEMSKPSAIPELNKAVFDGDVRTLKEYKELESQAKKLAKEKADLENKLSEKEEMLTSKTKMISTLIDKGKETVIEYQTDPKLIEELEKKKTDMNRMQNELSKKEKELLNANKQLSTVDEVKKNEKYIADLKEQVRQAKLHLETHGKEYKALSDVAGFIRKTKEFFTAEMVPVAMINSLSESYKASYRKDIITITEFINNWLFSVNELFGVKNGK